jgi:acetoacetyl-CoA synthetase
VWQFCGVEGTRGARALVDGDQMPGASFFPDARLNFTANVLKRRGGAPAILATNENGDTQSITWDELRIAVEKAAAALRAAGVREGDRVAGIVANTPETIVAALGAAAIGAVWSSCSPDFGVQGVLDRFGQISPAVLFTVDGYVYGGKRFDCLAKAAEVARALPGLKQVVVIR